MLYHNKNKSNLAKRGIAVATPTNSSFVVAGGSIGLTVWPEPHLTQRVMGQHKYTCKMPCQSVKRFEQGA